MAWFAGEPRKKETGMSDVYLLKRLAPYFLKEWKRISLSVIATVISVMLSLTMPLVIRDTLDKAIPQNDNSLLIEFILTYLLLVCGFYITSVIMVYSINSAGRKIVYTIREDSMAKIETLSMSYHNATPTGKTMSIIQNDAQRLLDLVFSGIVDNVSGILTLFGIYIIMWDINWKLSLVPVAFLPFIIIMLIFFRNKARQAYQVTRKTVSRLNIAFQEHISGIRVTKAFNREEYNFDSFQSLSTDNFEAQVKAVKYFAMIFPVFDIIVALTTIGIFYFGTPMVLEGSLTVGDLAAYLTYLTRLFDPILFFIMFYNTFQSSMAATERIVTLLDYPIDVKEANKEELISIKQPLEGKITIKNLNFSYDKGKTYIYKNFNLNINPGQSIAIVGPTGAGKTTLINLIARFYDIPKENYEDLKSEERVEKPKADNLGRNGSIYVDDLDIRKLPLREYRRSLGVILQESFLFNNTLRENITFGSPIASEDQIKEICSMIGIWDWIQSLEKGLDTIVGERGTQLSVGYRQLISLARTLLSNPAILLLDEATSSIDPYAEMLVQSALEKMIEDRTTIVIAHRLSTIRNSDRIIYIEDGKILEDGDFEKLIQLDGRFARQYKLQFSN